ncbi:50S ribosomal protein L24e [Candidatus Methanoperedenaceae archaeon GB50]|nr:MAG: 50S ribosomal protein L24e [Candidatus Methanoperedenaceae archaeon GB50]CAD7776951.1 50S ribosomal protein L24e [Candidatus Methanoperedenaceae archaeon GB37]CAD7777155.1 50S ribosomal protein L24e [Candidatus Methanoperedenaceae archaeon GB50]
MESRKCSFCGRLIKPGTGKIFVKRDGSIFHFCSSKCQKNHKLGRVPRKVRWTEEAHEIKEGIRH